jgi:hypothetical protein
VRRKQLDEDKLAYAFLLLARALREQEDKPSTVVSPIKDEVVPKPEAA